MASLVDWDYWLNTWPDHPIALTRANAADGYPKAMTPLSQDLVLIFEEQGVRRYFFHELAVLTPADAPDPYMNAYYGLIYLNADQLAGLGEATPGSSRQAMYQQFFGLEADPAYAAPKPSPRDRLGEAVTAVQVLPRMLRMAKTAAASIEAEIGRIRAARPPAEAALNSPGTLSDPELAAWLRRLDDRQESAWSLLMVGSSIAGAFFEIVRKQLVAWASDTTGDLLNRLHVGLGGNESAEAARAVRRLADLVRRENLAGVLDAADPEAALREASPAAAALLDGIITRFGHRAAAELELANPSWREDARPVLESVKVELRRAEQPDAALGIRAAAEQELKARLGPVRHRLVAPMLRRSQTLMAVRENGKIPAILIWDELRRILAVAGPRLTERGVLAEPAQILYLRHAELHEVLGGGAGPGVAELTRRQDAHARCLALDLPELVEVSATGIRPLDDAFIRERGLLPPEKLAADVTRLHGIAAAPGTLTGVARVLDDPFDEFDPGDILFARTVDPGWAPVLSCAGAVVLDIGGVLSHGAVVARELGIPCVVNVKVGTERAVSGSTVTVDGSAGEVVLA